MATIGSCSAEFWSMSSQQLATPHLFPWMQNTMGLDEDELELESKPSLSSCLYRDWPLPIKTGFKKYTVLSRTDFLFPNLTIPSQFHHIALLPGDWRSRTLSSSPTKSFSFTRICWPLMHSYPRIGMNSCSAVANVFEINIYYSTLLWCQHFDGKVLGRRNHGEGGGFNVCLSLLLLKTKVSRLT